MKAMVYGRLLRGAAALAATAALGVVGANLYAQAPGRKAVPAAPTSGGKFVDVTGDVYRSRQTPQGTISTISGNAVFRYEDSILRTDTATYNQRTQIATSPGKVQIDDAQNTIVGNQGVAYYRSRVADITGGVRIVARPRPQDRAAPEGSLRRDFKDPVTITCDRVRYNWRTRIATASGNLTFRQQGGRTLTADQAVYDGRAERVTLTRNVRGVDAKGSVILANSAIVTLREGEETVTVFGIKRGTQFPVENDDTEPPAPVGPAPVAPGLPGSPGATPPATPPAGPTTPERGS